VPRQRSLNLDTARRRLQEEYCSCLLLANHLYIAPALLMRGAHRRRSCKAEQGVASRARFATAPGRTTPSTPGGTTPRAAIAAWSREERKQNAGPGPKNATTERREAWRRVAPAPGSRLESESPRAVMHASGCRRSIRAPIGAPPAPSSGSGNGRKKKGRTKANRECENEDQKHKFVARMSQRVHAKRGPMTGSATCGGPTTGTPDIASLIRATAQGCLTS
jgi:hypothetical protein